MKRMIPFDAVASAASASHLRGLCAAVLALLFLLGAGGPSGAQTPSSFEGKYKGEWVARPAPGANWPDNEPEHVGTWDITIDAEGKVTGSEYDKTSDESGSIAGTIDAEGLIKIRIKYRVPVNISGKLAKKEAQLSGVLNQACGDSENVCVNIDLTLKRK